MEKEEAGQIAAEYAAENTVIDLLEGVIPRPVYIQKLAELMNATRTVSCVKGKDANSGTVDFVDVPDYPVQLNTVKTIIGLYGDNAPVKQDVKFPDKNGEPQSIGGLFTDLERATRLVYLLDQASKRKVKNAGRGKKD